MSLWQAIVLGIIQGVTEFLPVSSSGHLVIFREIFKIDLDSGILYDILLHIATLIVIVIVYRKDIGKLLLEGIRIFGLVIKNTFIFIFNINKKHKRKYVRIITTAYRRFVVLIILSTIPTGIIGLIVEKFISDYASSSLLIPGICLIITACLLMLADRTAPGTKKAKNATYKDAMIIGIIQGIATLPGLSRSGSTITACLRCGFDKSFAVKYSFIMSIPAIVGAAVVKLKDFANVQVSTNEIMFYIIGMICAGVAGYICMKTLLVIVRNKRFTGFSYYCMGAGIISVACYFII